MHRQTGFSILIATAFLCLTPPATAQRVAAYEEPPINYSSTITSNRADQINLQWRAGQLKGLDKHGLSTLRTLLKVLEIPEESQTLVFSKTSMQYARIAPWNPRALYFSDDAYFGWVPGGIYELVLNDPGLGLVFYEVDPHLPQVRRTRNCLTCHAGSRTRDWPGVLVRSVFPEEDGTPMGQAGGFVTGHDSPLEERWGGWYVTGHHGKARHLGNSIATWADGNATVDSVTGSNVTDLGGKFNTSKHLRPDSDIVALMVLEHQCEMHNRLSRALLRLRKWGDRQEQFQKLIGEPMPEEPSGTLLTVLNGETERILEYLLFNGEVKLPDGGIRGAGEFEKGFQRNRKEDSQGRSLKDFNLKTRLFKYRCSYMIYSEAFEILPDILKRAVYKRLFEVLDAVEPPEKYAHLPTAERRAIRAILLATKPEIGKFLERRKGL